MIGFNSMGITWQGEGNIKGKMEDNKNVPFGRNEVIERTIYCVLAQFIKKCQGCNPLMLMMMIVGLK